MRLRSRKFSKCFHISCAVFLLLGILFKTISRNNASFANAAEDENSQRQDSSPFERENTFAHKVVKQWRIVSEDVTALFLCKQCGTPPSKEKRIVALLEVRNVALSLYGFLRSLEDVVDAIVVLDDHSTDGSRADIFEMCHVRGVGSCKVEVVLNKTGLWIREELRDRDLLLRFGRAIGGTHFVLLDYDEYFSANCVSDGSLRDRILLLEPGQSLFVPWVEMWKSAHLYRVLPTDREMNFLIRRQTVVFADDGKVQYSQNSTNARTIGAHSGTIHALRCPRTICPRPPKYVGSQTNANRDPRVKEMPKQCHLIETRFLHVPNVLLKSAWYQGLGRLMGGKESSTRGKMLDVLFPTITNSLSSSVLRYGMRGRESDVALEVVGKDWLTARNLLDADASRGVELWRAEELVRWLDDLGDRQFSNLTAIRNTDTSSLRQAMGMSRLVPYGRMVHVPRRKRGTFVVGVDDRSVLCGTEFLETLGTRIEIRAMPSKVFPDSLQNRRSRWVLPEELEFEDWIFSLQTSIRSGVSKSRHNIAFFSAAGWSKDDLRSFIKVAENDFSEFDMVFLFCGMASQIDGETVKQAVKAAVVPGSHIRVLRVDSSAFGSYSALSWLRFRLSGEQRNSLAERKSVLALAEKLHLQDSTNRFLQLLPVSRIVFSLNVGRSGSKYVAAIMATLGRGVRGYHEPRCPDGKCSGGGAMAMQNLRLADSYQVRMNVKIPMIRSAIANISEDGYEGMVDFHGDKQDDCSNILDRLNSISPRVVFEANSGSGCALGRIRDFVYTETNPNFKSWFYDVTLDRLPKTGYKVSVIVLRKYIAAALKSLYETGYFTARNGYNWMETANGVNSEVQSIGTEDGLDAYDKLISYIVNAEAVTRKVMAKYGEKSSQAFPVDFVEMRSEEVYSRNGTMRLLQLLGLRATSRTMEKAGTREDKYGNGSEKWRVRTTSLEECERRVHKYLAKCKQLGVLYPADMDHLTRSRGFVYSQ